MVVVSIRCQPQEAPRSNIDGSNCAKSRQERFTVSAATGAGERVCLRAVPLKVRVKGCNLPPVETYALLDSGSEVTLCHEQLQRQLRASGPRLNVTLSEMTGSTSVDSQLLDIVLMSMDETVLVELSNLRTVKQMPISSDCIAKKEDLKQWPHLYDIALQEIEVRKVMLVVGLKEKPNLFLRLEYKAGREDEPVAVRYSLGWTVIGTVGGQRGSPHCSANDLQDENACANLTIKGRMMMMMLVTEFGLKNPMLR